MPYSLTHSANHTVEVAAHLDAETVDRERQTIIRSIRSKARIPGFRPGKAPEAAVRARFGEEIREELKEHLASVLWREVVEDEKDLRPLTEPKISSLEFGDDGGFRLSAQFEVRPNYEIGDLEAVELPVVSIEVSDAEVDEELERVREEQATWEPADDDAAEDGMLVEAELHGTVEGFDDDPYHEDDARFVIGSEAVPPEINEALQGARVGEEKNAEKTLPEDLEDADRAGKTVRYTIAVKTLKRKVLPEIDDDLATSMGLDSLDQLRERITQLLESRKVADRRSRWRRAVLDHLEQGIDQGELPPTLVQSTLREQLDRYAYTVAMQGGGVDPDTINWQEIAAKAEPAARQEVLDTLILEQLAGSWDVEVPEAEVDAYLAAEAARRHIPLAEHKANVAAENRLESIRHAARIAATVDEMIRRAGGEVE
ncbi:MAG: trigger factor [Acidobacteriota bacterium]